MLTVVFALCLGNLNPLSAQGITTASTKKDSVSNPSLAKKAINNPIHYEASDSIILRMENGKALLYNKAQVDMDETELNANYIEVAFASKTLFAKGNIDSTGKYINQPIFKDGNDAYTSDSLRYNNESKKGMVYGLSLTQDEAHVQLKQVMKQPDGSLMGNSGKISTCSDPHPHFYLNASKIKVIPNNKVLFGAANLVLADIPTPLALPFGIAPMKKGQRNGLIMPNPGFNNSNNSFFLSNLGYYQGLGKFADAQVNSDLYFNGDFRMGVTTNFIKRYKYSGALAINMSRFGNGTDRASPFFSKTNDFSINSRFGLDRKLLPGVTLNGNINIVTGNYNKRNSKDIQTLSKNEFVSSVNYGQSFLKNKVNLSASARHTQNVQTHDFRLELPNVNVGVSSLTPFAKKNGSNTKWFEQLRLSYNINFTNSLNTKDTLIFSDKYKDVLATIQSAVKHSIPLSTNIKLFKGVLNVTPSANYQEKWLFKANTKSIDPLTKQLVSKDTSGFFRLNNYSFSTGISTNIYGTFTKLNLGKIRSIRHTITPNVNFNYRPEIDGYERGWNRTYIDTFGKNIGYSLFEKYGGSDYVQRKGGAIGFSLSNNLQAKKVIGKDTTGKEKLEKANLIDQLMISGNYDLAADSLQWSDINLGFNTVIAKQIRIGINSGLSPYSYVNGRKINTLSAANGGPLLRYRGVDLSINSRITPELFGGKKSTENVSSKLTNPLKTDEAELRMVQSQPWNYFDFSIPWSMNFTYNVGYNNEIAIANNKLTNHRISVNGDISITQEWKIAYSTGYDLKRNMMAGSEFSVVRNLHCWQLEFKWIPSGYAKMWLFTLRPKSPLLQDLKLNKKVFSNPVLFQ